MDNEPFWAHLKTLELLPLSCLRCYAGPKHLVLKVLSKFRVDTTPVGRKGCEPCKLDFAKSCGKQDFNRLPFKFILDYRRPKPVSIDMFFPGPATCPNSTSKGSQKHFRRAQEANILSGCRFNLPQPRAQGIFKSSRCTRSPSSLDLC